MAFHPTLQVASYARALADSAELFFFQAEDGIRDVAVTGVQTCALPIYRLVGPDETMEVIGRGAVTVVDGSQVVTDAFQTKGHRPMMVSGAILHSIPGGYRDRKSVV